MAYINDRYEFIEYVQRKLGAPIVRVNVTEEQMDDCVDEALQMFYDYHHNGTENLVKLHELTQEDIDNQYITCEQSTISIRELWYDVTPSSIGGYKNANLKAMYEDLRGAGGVASFIAVEQKIAEFESLFVQKINWQYNRNSNKLRMLIDWAVVEVGDIVAYESVDIVDAELNPDVYNENWVKDYSILLVKKQWGINLSKFKNIELPGGMTIDGESMISEANDGIDKMRDEIIVKHSKPLGIYLG
jgi:hypothetical protein